MSELSKPVSYINSFLSMGEPLTIKRLLKARGTMAERGDVVKPVLDIKPSSKIAFMDKALTQIAVGITAKSITAPADAQVKKSKYSVSVD